MSEPSNYGQFYFCIKVAEDLSPDGEIYIHADKLEIQAGALACIRERLKRYETNLIIAPGKWFAAYAASIQALASDQPSNQHEASEEVLPDISAEPSETAASYK